VLGAVVPTYNLPGVQQQLRFSQALLAGIFLGKIKKWNDPAIHSLNPEAELPDLDIIVVHRSDSSGTSYVWTDALRKFDKVWRVMGGVGTTVEWPVGTGAKGNEGVAGFVNRTVGAIGYNELTYALINKLQYGRVQNRAGEYVDPRLESVTAAAAASLKSIPADLRFTLTNAPGKDSYPITGCSWALIYLEQPPEKKKALVDLLRWQTNAGQKYCAELGFAPLPKEIVELINEKLDSVREK
jgi:phosphate transport system substrate-binding protein